MRQCLQQVIVKLLSIYLTAASHSLGPHLPELMLGCLRIRTIFTQNLHIRCRSPFFSLPCEKLGEIFSLCFPALPFVHLILTQSVSISNFVLWRPTDLLFEYVAKFIPQMYMQQAKKLLFLYIQRVFILSNRVFATSAQKAIIPNIFTVKCGISLKINLKTMN